MKYNVFKVSKEEDKLFESKGYTHTYGYLTKSGVMQLLQYIRREHQMGIFYDLGCGNGELLMNLMTCNKNFSKYIGIEYSKERIIDFEHQIKKKRNIIDTRKIKAIHGDILDHNYSDGSVLYISNLCFENDLNKKIGELLSHQIKSDCIIFASKDIYLTLEHKRKVIYVCQSWSTKSELIKYEVY